MLVAGGRGILAVALVDVGSGRCLFTVTSPAVPDLSLQCAAGHYASMLRSQLEAAVDLQLDDEIEDVLLTLGRQYHRIRFVPIREYAGLFVYLVFTSAERETLAAMRQSRNAFASGSATINSVHNHSAASRDEVDVTSTASSEEELPPFMRTESVMRLIGIESEASETVSEVIRATG